MILTNYRFTATIKGFKSIAFSRVQLSRGSSDWGDYLGAVALERPVTADKDLDRDLVNWASAGDPRDIVVTSSDEKGITLATWTLVGCTPVKGTYNVGPFVVTPQGSLLETLIVKHKGVKV